MMIIETTKQYIAVDSIMASPTKRVLVIVFEASGCWASEVNAEDIERPSAKAGSIHPIEVVNPAVIMETIPMTVVVSIFIFFCFLKL
jgi:hypothetical protein